MKYKDLKQNHRLNDWISLVFKLGILVSLTLLGIGLIILAAIAGIDDIHPLVRLNQMPAAIIISVGILILLFTPVIPILLVIATFLREKNKLYLGISITIICLLVLTFVLAQI